MTYNVLSRMVNPTILYHTIPSSLGRHTVLVFLYHTALFFQTGMLRTLISATVSTKWSRMYRWLWWAGVMSGRGGTDSQVATVSDIRIPAVEEVTSSLLGRGRISAQERDTADNDGMHRTQRVSTGMRRRTAIRVIGPNSCRATKNLNSESFSTDIW